MVPEESREFGVDGDEPEGAAETADDVQLLTEVPLED